MNGLAAHSDDSGDSLGIQFAFIYLPFVAQNKTEPGLGAGIYADNVPLAAERGDVEIRSALAVLLVATKRVSTENNLSFQRGGLLMLSRKLTVGFVLVLLFDALHAGGQSAKQRTPAGAAGDGAAEAGI